MPKRKPWEPVNKADDSDPNPMRREGGLSWQHRIAPYDEIRAGGITLDPMGYVDQNIGGSYATPSDTPQAPGPRRGLYRYENKPSKHDPAPGKIGAE